MHTQGVYTPVHGGARPGERAHVVGTESDGSETCTISSIPLGKDCRQRFLFIRLPAIWNQISPEDTMKLQIFSVPVHLPTKTHRINIATLSLSSCYKLPRQWHFDQACVSPQAPLQVHTHHTQHTHTVCRVSPSPVCLQPLFTSDRLSCALIHGVSACLSRLSAVPFHFSLLSQTGLIDK